MPGKRNVPFGDLGVTVPNVPEGVSEDSVRELLLRAQKSGSLRQMIEEGIVLETPISMQRNKFLSTSAGFDIEEGGFDSPGSFRVLSRTSDSIEERASQLISTSRLEGHGTPAVRIVKDMFGGSILVARPGESDVPFREVDPPAHMAGGGGIEGGDILDAVDIPTILSTAAGFATGGLTGVGGLLARQGAMTATTVAGEIGRDELIRATIPGGVESTFDESVRDALIMGGVELALGVPAELIGGVSKLFRKTTAQQRSAISANQIIEDAVPELFNPRSPFIEVPDYVPILQSFIIQATATSPRAQVRRVDKFARALGAFHEQIAKLTPATRINTRRLLEMRNRAQKKLTGDARGPLPVAGRDPKMAQRLANDYKAFIEKGREQVGVMYRALDERANAEGITFDIRDPKRAALRIREGTVGETIGDLPGPIRLDESGQSNPLMKLVDDVLKLRTPVEAAQGPLTGRVFASIEQLRVLRTRAFNLSQHLEGKAGADAAAMAESLGQAMGKPIGPTSKEFLSALNQANEFTTNFHVFQDTVLTREVLRIADQEPRLLADRLVNPGFPDRTNAAIEILERSGRPGAVRNLRGAYKQKLMGDPNNLVKELDAWGDNPAKRKLLSVKDEQDLRDWVTVNQQAGRELAGITNIAQSNLELGERAVQAMLDQDPAVLQKILAEARGPSGKFTGNIKETDIGRRLRAGVWQKLLTDATEVGPRGIPIIQPRQVADNIQKLRNSGLLDVVMTKDDIRLLTEGFEVAFSFMRNTGVGESLQVAGLAASATNFTRPVAAIGAQIVLRKNATLAWFLTTPRVQKTLLSGGTKLSRGTGLAFANAPAYVPALTSSLRAFANLAGDSDRLFDEEEQEALRRRSTVSRAGRVGVVDENELRIFQQPAP